MADYEIVIRNDTAGNDSPIAGGNNEDGKDTGSTGGGSIALSKAGGIGSAIVSAGVKMADQSITHEIQTVSLRTGAEEHQERLSLMYSVGKRVAGSVMSIGMGAAVGGPVGAAVAAVGVLISGISEMISYQQKSEQLRLEKAVESVGLGYLNARAGGSVATFSGSRLGRQ